VVVSAREQAAGLLREVLGDGPVPVAELHREAEARGLAWRTVERAKAGLGVRAVRSGRGWAWVLPEAVSGFATAKAATSAEAANTATPGAKAATTQTVKAASASEDVKAATGTLVAEFDRDNRRSRLAKVAAPACAYTRHRPSDWTSAHGLRVCGICHPPAPGAAKREAA